MTQHTCKCGFNSFFSVSDGRSHRKSTPPHPIPPIDRPATVTTSGPPLPAVFGRPRRLIGPPHGRPASAAWAGSAGVSDPTPPPVLVAVHLVLVLVFKLGLYRSFKLTPVRKEKTFGVVAVPMVCIWGILNDSGHFGKVWIGF